MIYIHHYNSVTELVRSRVTDDILTFAVGIVSRGNTGMSRTISGLIDTNVLDLSFLMQNVYVSQRLVV